MSKFLRYGLRILAGFLLLWVIVVAGAWIYLKTHKAQLTDKTNTFLNSRFQGTIHIGDIGINLWNDFPYPALQVNNLTIDDSVYSKSGQHTLYMEKVRIIPGFKGMLSGSPSIRKIILVNGGIYLYKDSSGYDNSYVWSSRQKKLTPVSNGPTPSLPLQIQLKDIDISIADSIRHKSYGFHVHQLSMLREDSGWRTNLDVTVRSLAFSTRKGSFLRDQEIKGKGILEADIEKKLLSFQNLALDIDRQGLLVDGAFHFDSSSQFKLHINAPFLDFSTARSWLPYKIGRKLDSLSFEHPLAIDARIEGVLAHGNDPRVLVKWTVRNNTLSGYIGKIYDCSFTGYFNNSVRDDIPTSDANSLICADSLEGKYENKIAFHTRRLAIIRLDTAVMAFDLGVHNDVSTWQELLRSDDLSFDKGTVDMDLTCRFPLTDSTGIFPEISGSVKIKDAEITYVPRHVKIADGQVQLAFDHQDLLITKISGRIGKSPVEITGSARHLLAFAGADTNKMALDWRLYSPSLDLEALLPFLGKSSSRTGVGRADRGGDITENRAAPGRILDRFIKRCQIKTQLQIDRLSYAHFSATQVSAILFLDKGLVTIPAMSLHMASGVVSVSGSLSPYGDESNKVQLSADLSHIDLPALFYAFDDFGQPSLGARNLSGTMNAQTDLSLLLTNKGRKIPGTLEGSLHFTIDQGALLNFSPLTKLSNFALKNRDLSHVYFSQLHDTFGFSRDTVSFNKMEIQSCVLVMFVEGVYKLDGQYTNADIQVPFNNLKKRKDKLENVGVDAKHGLSIYVHAYNTGAEPLHYKFGLFKKKTGIAH